MEFDARIGQQRDVEARGFLRLSVEPQAWSDRRHRPTPLEFEQKFKSAIDEALAVERHVGAVGHSRVGHDFLAGRIAHGFRRPEYPRKHNVFARLRLHRPLEVGDLAIGHVVAPTFHHAQRAIFFEDRRYPGGQFAIGLLFSSGHRNHESVDISHDMSPLVHARRVTPPRWHSRQPSPPSRPSTSLPRYGRRDLRSCART